MRKLLPIVFSFILISASFSQDLKDLVSLPGLTIVIDFYNHENSQWSMSAFYQKDTFYQDKTYHQYIRDNSEDFYLRVDGDKLLIKEVDLTSEEKLMSDFGVMVDDQFPPNTIGNSITVEVASVDSEEFLDGLERRIIELVYADSKEHFATWIEGLGTKEYGYFPKWNDWDAVFRCSSSDMGSIYITEDFTEEECAKRSCPRLSSYFEVSENSDGKYVEIVQNLKHYDSVSMTFGDGIYFDELITHYEYEERGCYFIELTTFDDCGNESSTTRYYNYCEDELYTTNDNTLYRDMAFKDKDNGIAVINNKPHYTTDAGFTWHESEVPEAINNSPNYIWPYLNGDKGIMGIAGDATNYPKALYTKDGGVSWKGIIDDGWYPRSAASSNGYIFIGNYDLLRTKDEGQTWEKIDHMLSGGLKHIYISKTDKIYVIYASSSGYSLYTSDDYGESWNLIYNNDSGRINSVYFVDNINGFVALDNRILKTADGGQSWETVFKLYGHLIFHKLRFSDDMNGMVLQGDKVFRTKDSGYTWFAEFCENPYYINDGFLFDDEEIYLLLTINILYRRNENPNHECDELSSDLEELEQKISVFPNPVQNKLFLTHPKLKKVSGAVYDLKGNQVVKYHEIKTDQIDVEHLAQGMYYLQLISGDEHKTFKFVKH